ncbi:MAG TPA: 5-oxoprolinase subunit PxpB [Firmicutes bacterium]|nr:5-oxoprolinase subunit PxpB [Bacillota bacterium]
MDAIRFLPCGDSAVTVEFGNRIDDQLNGAVHAFASAVEALGHPAIREVVPTYRSATVHYLPHLLEYAALVQLLRPLTETQGGAGPFGAPVEIPVLYGGPWGPDLEEVAAHCGMTPEQVIAAHSAPCYRIYMLGFTPGFPYLGGMDPRLATPRRKEPRIRIPAGSVGIAGSQTGVYPIESPGGWQLIGRTPLRLFDLGSDPPILLQAGRSIRFVPIDEPTYHRLERRGRL